MQLEAATEGLSPEFLRYLTKIREGNGQTIANFLLAMKFETDLSDNYRRSLIKTLSRLSQFCNNKPFKSISRHEIISFLDSFRKPEDVDPMHKWIGTYNLYLTYLIRFFKWLYFPHMDRKDRPKPSIIQNLHRQKRREPSTYKPTDLWSTEDDALFLRYCPSKRIKFYHTGSRDLSNRPSELLKAKIKDLIWHVTADKKQYCEILINGKTGSRQLALFDSIPYLKDYLENEHPMPGNPNAPLICGLGRSLGRHMSLYQLYTMYVRKYQKEYFPKLLDRPDVLPEDKPKIRELLKKPWNPYIRRHTGLTEKSLKIPGLLNQYASWTPGSTMGNKYLHYFGNESNKGLLQAYGIISKEEIVDNTLKPRQCPNCSELNKLDSKWCTKCKMLLSLEAYNDVIEQQKEKEDKLTIMEERFNSMQSQMQSLVSALGSMDQSAKNTFAKQLFESGIYKRPTE